MLDDDVDGLPEADFAQGDEYLRVLRLGQHEVERALPDVLHQPDHVRLN